MRDTPSWEVEREAEKSYASQPPDQLLKFKSWWNAHSEPREIIVLNDLAASGKVIHSPTFTDGKPVVGTVGSFIYSPEDPPPGIKHTFYLPYLSEELSPGKSICPTHYNNDSQWVQDGPVWYYHGFLGDRYTFVLGGHTRCLTLRNTDFMDVPHNCVGFESCFPELAMASVGMESLTLEDLRTHLIQQLEKGDSVFEAFGLKIPLSQLTLWGVIVVFAVQLYFVLHLRELHSKIAPEDEGLDVAWIGVYRSALSRMSFYISIIALPIGAIICLITTVRLNCRVQAASISCAIS